MPIGPLAQTRGTLGPAHGCFDSTPRLDDRRGIIPIIKFSGLAGL
jgi:hypothetical protein